MCISYSSPFFKFTCLLNGSISMTHRYFKFSIHTTHLLLPHLLFLFSAWLRHHNQLSFQSQKRERYTRLFFFCLLYLSIQSPSPINFTSSASLESILFISTALVQCFVTYSMDFFFTIANESSLLIYRSIHLFSAPSL